MPANATDLLKAIKVELDDLVEAEINGRKTLILLTNGPCNIEIANISLPLGQNMIDQPIGQMYEYQVRRPTDGQVITNRAKVTRIIARGVRGGKRHEQN